LKFRTRVSLLWLCDLQLLEIEMIEMEIQRKKEELKKDDRRQRNLARQVNVTQICERQSVVRSPHKVEVVFNIFIVPILMTISEY